MKLIAYTVDLRFINAPTVTAEVAVVDPVTGAESVQALRFNDDEGRAIHVMAANPKGGGLVATGEIDLAALDAAIVGRLAEAFEAPTEIGARIAAAEKARKDVAELSAALAAKQTTAADVDAQIAAKIAQASALDAEIAAKEAAAAEKA